jgi:hypothetical protein
MHSSSWYHRRGLQARAAAPVGTGGRRTHPRTLAPAVGQTLPVELANLDQLKVRA